MSTETLGLGDFGKYLLLKRLAAGGMAEVFLARPASSEANGRVVVIKRILAHVADDTRFLSMFKSEIHVCMGLNHPNTVQIYDFGDVTGQPYIAMEFVEGRNLKQVANKFAAEGLPVPIEMVLSIGAQIAAGLHYAHTFQNGVTGENLNLIHRDVSPHNLILSYDGNIKIIDFGIAKAAMSGERTATGTIKGKASYVSPEQTICKPLDGRSDVFSLAVVLWELLTGVRLFDGESDLTILRKVMECETVVKPPSAHNPAVPKELDDILMKALAKSPEQRHANAAEFQKELRDLLMTYRPGYSYSEVARTMQGLFRDELDKDRRQLRELNERAQQTLTDTVILADTRLMAAAPSASALPPPVPTKKPASFGSRKVKWKHLALALVYILTIAFIKLDQQYFFFDRFMLPTSVVRHALAAPKAFRVGSHFGTHPHHVGWRR